MKVYIVSQPECDCDIIHGVFSSKKLANEAVKTQRKKSQWIALNVECYELDKLCREPL